MPTTNDDMPAAAERHSATGDKPKIWLVTYATPIFYRSAIRLARSVRGRGVDAFRLYTPKDLPESFRHEHRDLLRQWRGGGYWIWKPFVLLHALREAAPGDIVIYLDAGMLVVDDLAPLIELLDERRQIALFQNLKGRLHRSWTKRDAFILLGADSPKYWNARSLSASYIVMKNGEPARRFAADWLEAISDPRVVSDIPNQLGQPNLSGFRAHRHDQAALSILAQQRNIELFRDPSQNGRQEPPMQNSAYGTLIYRHGLRGSKSRSWAYALIPARMICRWLWRHGGARRP